MSKLKDILAVSGLILGFAVILNFYIWFLVALTNPTMSVMVSFNQFSEGMAETAAYVIIFPLILFSIYYYSKGFMGKYTIRQTNKQHTVGQTTIIITCILISIIGVILLILGLTNR